MNVTLGIGALCLAVSCVLCFASARIFNAESKTGEVSVQHRSMLFTAAGFSVVGAAFMFVGAFSS